jgi:hypothetical protein
MVPEDLYGLGLERFVPERGALARTLRAEGRRDEAADVMRLRKPSVAAWAVNQLVRAQGTALTELFAAGDALRDAQASVLAGRGDGGALRASAERERAAVDALVSEAEGVLAAEGHEHSRAIIDRVADTFHAAAFDDDARVKVRTGRLVRELRHVGLGAGVEPAAGPAPGSVQPKPPPKDEHDVEPKDEHDAKPGAPSQLAAEQAVAQRHERERIAAEQAAAQRRERDRMKARTAARATEAETRRLADRAGRAVQVAEEHRERVAESLRNADQTLATARADSVAATERHRRAHEELQGI